MTQITNSLVDISAQALDVRDTAKITNFIDELRRKHELAIEQAILDHDIRVEVSKTI